MPPRMQIMEGQEPYKKTYTRDEVEAAEAKRKLIAEGGTVEAEIDPDYEAFLRWKQARQTPNQPVMVGHPHPCPDCVKQFPTERGLRLHRLKMHPDPAA